MIISSAPVIAATSAAIAASNSHHGCHGHSDIKTYLAALILTNIIGIIIFIVSVFKYYTRDKYWEEYSFRRWIVCKDFYIISLGTVVALDLFAVFIFVGMLIRQML